MSHWPGSSSSAPPSRRVALIAAADLPHVALTDALELLSRSPRGFARSAGRSLRLDVLRDSTRFVFHRFKSYARVLFQQGRVPLDADYVEDAKPPPDAEMLEPRHEREKRQ